MKELIKQTFDLWNKYRWLKSINKEIKKLEKLAEETRRHKFVANGLIQRYNEIFGEHLTEIK